MEFQMSGEDYADMGLPDPGVELMGAGFLKRMARKTKNATKQVARNKFVRAAAFPQGAALSLAHKRMGSELMGAGFLKRMVRKTKNATKQAAGGVATVARTAARSKLVKDVAGAAVKAAMPQLAAMNLANKLIPSSVRKAGNAIADQMPKRKAPLVAAMPKVPRGASKPAPAKAKRAAGFVLTTPMKIGIGVGGAAALLLVAKAMSGGRPAAA